MALKDRVRKALSRSSSSIRPNSVNSSTSSSGTNPGPSNTLTPMPSLTLTKSSSRLSKTFSFLSDKERTKQRKVEKWEEADRNGPGKDRQHHEILRAFEWKGAWGRRGSSFSHVSPSGTPRIGSLDSGYLEDKRRISGGKMGDRKLSTQSGGTDRMRSLDVVPVIEE